MAIPAWIPEMQALATPIIAIAAAVIAGQQMCIARSKLQHDLYDRRYAIFNATRDLLGALAGLDRPQLDTLRAFEIGTGDARFILNDNVAEYLETIKKHANTLISTKIMLEDHPPPLDHQRLPMLKSIEDHHGWLSKQMPTVISKFRPFLELERQSSICSRLLGSKKA
jgi:hypothetical protein